MHNEPTEQHAVSFGSSAGVYPVASGLVKASSQVAMAATMATMDSSASPEGDCVPVPEADRA